MGRGPGGRSPPLDGKRHVAYEKNVCTVSPPDLNRRGGGAPNRVKTTRFTLLTWLPKSLFHQFKRVANLYFLFVSTIICIPEITRSRIMWTSTVIPFCVVLSWTALKDMYEDLQRRRDDDAENARKCLRFSARAREFVEVRWRDVLLGDILLSLQDEALPADVLLVCASNRQAFISTVNLDGETNLKERHAAELLSATMEAGGSSASKQRADAKHGGTQAEAVLLAAAQSAEALFDLGLEAHFKGPQVSLTEMDGTVRLNTPTKSVVATLRDLNIKQPGPLNYEHFVPRGCMLRNTAYVVSIVAYAGSDTKSLLNCTLTRTKFSNMQVYLNCAVVGLVMTLFAFCSYATVRADMLAADGTLFALRFLWFCIVLYQIVPISLYVCFEIIKLILGFQINRDPQMVEPATKKAAVARTADLVEEMGQVDFVFSDKTGTLTRNEMVFARCCVAGQDMGDFRPDAPGPAGGAPPGVAEVRRVLGKEESELQRAETRWFFFCLVTCHSAHVDMDRDMLPRFSGSSPDEVAFLEAAHSIGITYQARRRLAGSPGWELHITGPPGEGNHKFKVLCEIPFTSDRKRMTVVCEYKGEFFCICKGADSVMGPLCDEPFDRQSTDYLAEYSRSGFRTLVIASKILERDFLERWRSKLDGASSRADGREEALAVVASEIEHSLMLSGVTAIEDRLQAGVPQAIVTIRAAGIRFWVLTGDKTETAVEVARSCSLFAEGTALAYMVNCTSAGHALDLLRTARTKLEGSASRGLILDGTLVSFALADRAGRNFLYELAAMSQACVCCRLSPQQKRKLVELVKERDRRSITLAIGDGANDVSMIQGAHIGIGIRGKEGNQAVQASDVAISQFRFLVPLLLCHGRRAYRRVATFLCYIVYKHVALALGDMIWAHQSSFEGGLAYPEYLSSAFPGVLTALPMIVILGFDRDVPDSVANQSPGLYAEGLRRMHFNPLVFVGWMVSAVWHGSLAWAVPAYLVGSSDHDSDEFWRASCCSFTLVVVFVNLRLWMIALNPLWFATVAVLLLSLALLGGTLFLLGETPVSEMLQPQIQGVPRVVFTEWRYLRTMVITPACLFLDLAFFWALRRVRPTPLDLARRKR